MRVGREHVAAKADLRNLLLRGQATAAEAVDAEHRARPGHLTQHPFHLVRVIRQFLNLAGAENRGEDVTARVAPALTRIAADVYGFVQLVQHQLHRATRVAPHLQSGNRSGLESVRFHAHIDARGSSQRQVGSTVALGAGHQRLAPGLRHLHRGADEERVGGIDDRDRQHGRCGLCRRGAGGGEERHRHQPDATEREWSLHWG